MAGCLVTAEPFTIDGGELTPNLKLRRAMIESKYEADIDRLYRKLELPGSGTEAIDEAAPVILCPGK